MAGAEEGEPPAGNRFANASTATTAEAAIETGLHRQVHEPEGVVVSRAAACTLEHLRAVHDGRTQPTARRASSGQ
jgi:hypothetical protein